jgi:hypothetical protein
MFHGCNTCLSIFSLFVNFFSRSFLFLLRQAAKKGSIPDFSSLIYFLSVQGNNSASDSSRPPGALQTSLQ